MRLGFKQAAVLVMAKWVVCKQRAFLDFVKGLVSKQGHILYFK